MKIFIVFYCEVEHQQHHFVESVWSTYELAKSAIHYHSRASNTKFSDYRIIEREVNVAIANG